LARLDILEDTYSQSREADCPPNEDEEQSTGKPKRHRPASNPLPSRPPKPLNQPLRFEPITTASSPPNPHGSPTITARKLRLLQSHVTPNTNPDRKIRPVFSTRLSFDVLTPDAGT